VCTVSLDQEYEPNHKAILFLYPLIYFLRSTIQEKYLNTLQYYTTLFTKRCRGRKREKKNAKITHSITFLPKIFHVFLKVSHKNVLECSLQKIKLETLNPEHISYNNVLEYSFQKILCTF